MPRLTVEGASTVDVADGTKLVLAIGADPIRLPLAGDGAADVLSVNDLDDFARFHAAIQGRKRVAVMGAGLIGCEFANDLLVAGFEVDIVDIAPLPLGRLLPEQPRTLFNAGLSLTALGRDDEARASYARSVGLDPKYVDPRANLGLLLLEKGAVPEALAHLLKYDSILGRLPYSVAVEGDAIVVDGKAIKIVAERAYGEVLGVHMIGPRATELVAEATLALRLESTVEELIRTIHAHPTMSEAVGEAAHATHGAAIHV